ncbi:hypothetical protein TVAG_105160 [Trichomonas vaginalis G3]|uniref:MHD1 domain-containing protein n=1 Tax=Trichomonas vaginalis (strain ATCC PRA-98 / G3) TaxID=412133 RepID=A2FH75_TRIV3|nr:Munc13 (mammalian uncoordinated) homology domain-containing protein [Trichomonas vaginalis G3]EAX95757.1 hypothetical protein TVAG_105160 [Trichomonas vaginalis G3]KAI5527907.1 Munc13 (mammalian uncoordinated) homology domain-containing protein [Trichomonas vaginalis G3]|eukprot:XP_001308687.1 hypothetical protein [Trichomonas vaginalis G3]
MENNMFQELIDMANEIVEGANDEQQITEEKALEIGKTHIHTELKTLTPLDYEVLVHDMAVPLCATLFDSETGALTPYGAEFAEDFAAISQDIPTLMSYFSKYARSPNLKLLTEDVMSPFALFKFLRSIFESPGTLLPALQFEQPILSEFIVKVFSNVKTLASKITYSNVYREIYNITNSLQVEDKKFITDIVDDAIAECSVTSYLGRGTKFLSDEVRAYVIKETGATDEMLDELRTKIGHTTNYLMFNTYLHQQANTYEKTWINSFKGTKETFKDAQQNLLALSQKVGEMMAKKPPVGNMHVQINIKWEPKYQNTHLTRTAFLELSYLGYTTTMSLASNYAEFVLPYFDKNQKIEGRILYISEKNPDLPFQMADEETSKLIHYFEITDIEKDTVISEKFKKLGGVVTSTCGDMNSIIQIKKSDIIPVTQPQLSSDNLDLSVILDYLTTKLVIDWTRTTGRMPLVPPQDFFIAIIDFAFRHSIPSSVVFVSILSKLYEGWCEAESYLNAFTALFMVARNCCELNQTPETTKDAFENIVKDMQKKVPLELYNRLKNPVKYERSSLMPLLTLTGLIVEGDVRALIDKFLKEAKSFFVKSMLFNVKPVLSEKPTTQEANILWEYIRSINPSAHNDYQHFTFTVTSLADSMSIVSQRSKLAKSYYETNVVPVDFKTITGDTELFSQITIYLLNAFLKIPIELNDKVLFKFVFAYREVWEYLKLGPDYSPFKLFFDIVLEWITSISTRLIDWTQKTVEVDTFEVTNPRLMTSTSIGDLMTMFSQSFSFVNSLKWKNKNIVDIIFTYISTCVCCLKLYTELLTFRIVKYFPRDIIINTTDNLYVISAMKQLDTMHNISAATPQQMYVMINDFSQIKVQWSEFLHNVRPLVGASPIPDQFVDPVPYVSSIMAVIPPLFSALIEHEVYDYVSTRLWVDNSSFKKIFVKKASKKVLHPEFDSRSSSFFNDLFNKCTDFIKIRADQLTNHVNKENMIPMLSAFFRGMDAGLMNILLAGEPIKHKRVVVIMNFIQDLLASLFEPMRDDFGVTAKQYVEWAWRSRLCLDYLKASPQELVGKMNSESGQKGLIFDILVRSHTNDKYAVENAMQKDAIYLGARFTTKV